jgi:hypothetical protein
MDEKRQFNTIRKPMSIYIGDIRYTLKLHLAAKTTSGYLRCEGERYWTDSVKYKCYTKTANINLQKLTCWNLVLRTKIMTPVKSQNFKYRQFNILQNTDLVHILYIVTFLWALYEAGQATDYIRVGLSYITGAGRPIL